MTEHAVHSSDRLLTTLEVSQTLRLSRKTVRDLIHRGELRAARISPTEFRVSHQSVQDWIARQLDAPVSEPEAPLRT